MDVLIEITKLDVVHSDCKNIISCNMFDNASDFAISVFERDVRISVVSQEISERKNETTDLRSYRT